MNDEVDVPSVEDAVSVLISLSDDRAGVEGYLTAELLSELNYEELFTTLVTRFQAGTVPVWLLSNVASAVIKAACDAQLDLSAKRAVLQSLLTAVILSCPPLLRDDDLETFEKRVCSGDGEALTFDFYKFVAAAANATLIVPEMTLKEKCGITYRSLGILTRRMREGEGLSAADQWAILEAINVTKDSCPHGNVFREETLAVLRTLSSASPAAHDNIVTWNACRSALRGNMRALAESSKSESGAVVPGSSFAASSRKTSVFTPSPSRQGSSSGSGFSSRFSLWPSSSSSSSSSAKAATTSAGSGSAAGAEAESPREQSAGGRVLKSEAPSDDSPLLTGGATLGSVREHEQEDEDEPDAEAEPEAEAVAEAKAEAEAAEEEDEEEAAALVKTKSRSKSKGRSKKKGHSSPSANGAARASAQDEDEDAAREEGEKEASAAAYHQHQQQQNHHQAPSPSLLSSRLSPATSPSTAPASPEPAAAAASPAPGKNKGKSLSFSFGSFIRPSSSSSSSSSAAPAPTATTVAAAASSSPKLSSPSFSSSPSPSKARAVSPTEIASASTSSDVDVLRAAVTSLTEECAALKAALASQLMQTHRVKGEYTKRALEVSELQTRLEVIELQTEVDNAERLLGKEKAILLREAFATTTTPSDEDEGKPKKGGGQGSKKGQGSRGSRDGSSSSSSSPRSSSPHTVPANTLTIKNSATGSVLASAGASEGTGGKRTLSPLRNGGPAKPTRPKSAARSRARSSSPKPRAKTAAADGGARASAAADKKDSKGGKAAAAGTDGKVPHKPETPKKSGASPRPNTTSGSSSKSARK